MLTLIPTLFSTVTEGDMAHGRPKWIDVTMLASGQKMLHAAAPSGGVSLGGYTLAWPCVAV